MSAPAPAPGLYRHFKGGAYEVLIAEACAHESGERVVVYRSCETGAHHTRLLSSFVEEIALADGSKVARFARVEPVR